MTGVLSAPGPRRILGGACSDHELVARVREGEDRAFEVLFERYRPRITAYIRGMVHDHARAEDIAQEVFLSALRRMRETDRSIAFKPWIYEIAKNACIDAHRRARRAQEVSYDHDEALAAADHGRLVSTRAVADAVETRESLENLQGAIGSLSESHADILVLRELEGLSYQEIGERLGMSRASVESTLFRARKRLESEYNDLVSGERCRQVQANLGALQGGRPRLRDRRQLSRHLAWCQACRHEARLAGVEVGERVPLRKKVGALLPVPAFIRERLMRAIAPGPWAGGGDPVLEWGRAAVAAAAVAIAGIGAGSVIGGGPVVNAHGYSPVPGLFGGGGEDGSPPLLRTVGSMIGTDPAMAGRQLPFAPAGSGVLGAPVSAGPLAPAASPVSGGQPGVAGAPGVSGAAGAVGGAAQASVGGVVGGAGQAVGGVGGTVNGVGQTVGGAVNGVTGTAGTAVQGATQTAGETVRGVTQTTSDAVSGATQTVGGLVRDVTTNPTNVGGAVDNAVSGTTRTVTDAVQGTTNTASRTVQNTTQTATNTVSGTTQTATNTVTSATQTVTSTVSGVTQAATGTTTTSAPAPAQTTTSTQSTSATPVQDVVEQTTSVVGSVLGGGG
jgi:RNA polymerase sigma factor (sigma-70 family)